MKRPFLLNKREGSTFADKEFREKGGHDMSEGHGRNPVGERLGHR